MELNCSQMEVLWTVKTGFVRVIEWNGRSAFCSYMHSARGLISDG